MHSLFIGTRWARGNWGAVLRRLPGAEGTTQRMLGIGNLSLEPAGETSRLVMRNVDSPDHVAESILHIAHANAEASGGRSGPAHV